MQVNEYIDPTMRDHDRYEEFMDEEVEKLRNKIPDIVSIDYKLAHSPRHYNPFCSFKVFCQKPGEKEKKEKSFLIELHENDTDRSIEILERAFNGLRGEVV